VAGCVCKHPDSALLVVQFSLPVACTLKPQMPVYGVATYPCFGTFPAGLHCLPTAPSLTWLLCLCVTAGMLKVN
jgi:hypothetical protein